MAPWCRFLIFEIDLGWISKNEVDRNMEIRANKIPFEEMCPGRSSNIDMICFSMTADSTIYDLSEKLGRLGPIAAWLNKSKWCGIVIPIVEASAPMRTHFPWVWLLTESGTGLRALLPVLEIWTRDSRKLAQLIAQFLGPLSK